MFRILGQKQEGTAGAERYRFVSFICDFHIIVYLGSCGFRSIVCKGDGKSCNLLDNVYPSQL